MNIINELIKEAKKAYKQNEIPVGCVIIKNNKIISKAHNTKQQKHKCINHAEILAITKAESKLKDWRLNDCELYVTLEPCKMCKEVIRQSRITKVHYLLPSQFNNEDLKQIIYKEIEKNNKVKTEYLEILQSFFKNKR